MSCEIEDIYFNNDHTLTIDGLKDANDAEMNSATITYAFYDSDGTAVSGASGSMTAVGTGGDYTATIDQAIIDPLISGNEYTVRITGAQSGTDFEFNITTRIGRRGST